MWQKLLCLGCFNRASAFASAAVDALVCIDNVFAVLFGDAVYGAFLCASAAADALFCVNDVCHVLLPPRLLCDTGTL